MPLSRTVALSAANGNADEATSAASRSALTGCPWHDVKTVLREVGLRPTDVVRFVAAVTGREIQADAFNGRLDGALYEAGRLDRSLPFLELRLLAYLNDIANQAPEEGFGDHIRRELERRRNE